MPCFRAREPAETHWESCLSNTCWRAEVPCWTRAMKAVERNCAWFDGRDEINTDCLTCGVSPNGLSSESDLTHLSTGLDIPGGERERQAAPRVLAAAIQPAGELRGGGWAVGGQRGQGAATARLPTGGVGARQPSGKRAGWACALVQLDAAQSAAQRRAGHVRVAAALQHQVRGYHPLSREHESVCQEKLCSARALYT